MHISCSYAYQVVSVSCLLQARGGGGYIFGGANDGVSPPWGAGGFQIEVRLRTRAAKTVRRQMKEAAEAQRLRDRRDFAEWVIVAFDDNHLKPLFITKFFKLFFIQRRC